MGLSLSRRLHRTLDELEGPHRDLEQRVIALTGELAEANRRLEIAVTHDALTGVLARRTIQERAELELQRSQRVGRPCTVGLLDADRFKSINDTYGHPAGDQALRALGRALEATLRPYDSVGRWRGEEFLVVLPETGRDEALAVAERLRAVVAALEVAVEGHPAVRLSASLGLASSPRRPTRPSTGS